MKYPQQQFDVLVSAIKEFNKYVDVTSLNPFNLHQMVYNQFSEGQKHNRLLVQDGVLVRAFRLLDGELIPNEGTPLINYSFGFELYPNNTNDSHIETAMKNAIKAIN